jgi:S1-C subfamily serine protease
MLRLFAVLAAAALLPDEENTIKVFREAAPSVVFVTNVAVVHDFYMDEAEIPQGSGTGFIWDKDGHVVTNYHIVHGGDSFLVTLKDQTEFKAVLVGAEPRKDVAVLKLQGKLEKIRPIPLGSSAKLMVGQKTVAIGNPFGLDHTLTTGIISALGRQVPGIGGVKIRDMIQTDAAINPGNSGGPLLDSEGRLIGMNTLIYSRSGSSAGIGFAVPVDSIKKIVPQLIRSGRVTQPGMGVGVLTDEQKRYLLGRDVEGVIIRDVAPASPAAKAGLRGIRRDRSGRLLLGDVVISINGKKVKEYDDLYHLLDGHSVGDTISLEYLREGKTRSARLQLISLP